MYSINRDIESQNEKQNCFKIQSQLQETATPSKT